MTELSSILADAPVIPLVQADDAAIAVQTAAALAQGGLRVVEVVFRTDAALECLQAVADSTNDVVVGAGTVLTAAQAKAAIAAGARFIVSPGLDDAVVGAARDAGIPAFPGIYTPSELQHAVALGLDVVKFFPATVAGGVPALKALASVFRNVQFIPTGGISQQNLREFLGVPAVLACGGSWLTPAESIAQGDFARITELALAALSLAAEVRSR